MLEALWNAARCKALQGDHDGALEYLETVMRVDLGYFDKTIIDKDFTDIVVEDRFKTLIDKTQIYEIRENVLIRYKGSGKDIIIPALYNVKIIGVDAFSGCTGLTSVDIPDSVTSIGDRAFDGCTGLTNVNIPNSVTSIGDYAFYGCTRLANVNIPNSVTSIGFRAFDGCMRLTSVNIQNPATSIGDRAFDGCIGLTSIPTPGMF